MKGTFSKKNKGPSARQGKMEHSEKGDSRIRKMETALGSMREKDSVEAKQ